MQKRNSNRLSSEIRAGERYLIFGLIFLMALITVLFFIRTSTGAQQGYALQQLQLQKSQLQSQNHDLKLQVLEAQSTQNATEEAEKHMSPADNPIYIE